MKFTKYLLNRSFWEIHRTSESGPFLLVEVVWMFWIIIYYTCDHGSYKDYNNLTVWLVSYFFLIVV